jgi:hypothetical protein
MNFRAYIYGILSDPTLLGLLVGCEPVAFINYIISFNDSSRASLLLNRNLA